MRVEGFIRQEAIAREREKNRPQRERYQWSDEELERIERSKVRKVMLEFFQDERHRELSSQEYKFYYLFYGSDVSLPTRKRKDLEPRSAHIA